MISNKIAGVLGLLTGPVTLGDFLFNIGYEVIFL